jgi:hypothetical protein
MTTKMKRVFALLLASACVVFGAGTVAYSAANPEAVADMLRQDLASKKSEMMGRALLLSREESDKFWPVYREYDRERAQLDGRAVNLINDYVKNYRTLDDAKAKELLETLFSVQEQRLSLLRKYATQLQATLPMRQVAGFVQVEFQLLRLLDVQRSVELPRMR